MSQLEQELRAEIERLRAKVAALEQAASSSSSISDIFSVPVASESMLHAADETLRESEARYRTLFEHAPTGLGVADIQGQLLAFNDAMLEPGGYTREDIRRIGNVAELYYDAGDRERALAIARQDGCLRNHEVRLKRKDGSFYYALLSLSPVILSGRPGWLAMVQDITARKEMEEALVRSRDEMEAHVRERTANLQAANERLQAEIVARQQFEVSLHERESAWRSLVEYAPDVVMTIDRQGIILFINRTVPGFTVEGTIGTHTTLYMAPEMHATFQELLDRVFEEGTPQAYETAAHGPYREPAWYQSRLGPVFRDGQVVAAILIATDITPRKRAEEELRAEQQLLLQLLRQQELDRQLVAYEIHDGLVQYITGALMRLDALADQREATLAQVESELTAALDLLRTSIREARRLISGLRPPILDEAGIASAIRYLIGEHRGLESPQISLHTQLDDKRFPPALESTLFRICQEALTNAVKHSRAPRVNVSLGLSNGSISLSVADDGVGFDTHTTSKKSFGLQGIRERARLMGGKATIESTPGAGAKVSVELPLEPKVG